MIVSVPEELRALLNPDMEFYKEKVIKYLEYRSQQEFKRILSAQPSELPQIQTRLQLLEELIRKLTQNS